MKPIKEITKETIVQPMSRPQLTYRNGFNLIGLEIRTSTALEANPGTGKIPGLWERFFQERLGEKIPRTTNPGALFGVRTNYGKDADEEYSLIAGCQVGDFEHVPEGMKGLKVPAGKYLVFSGRGSLPEVIANTWDSIEKYFAGPTDHQRAYTADFEFFPPGNTPRNFRVDVYVALK